MMWEYRIGSVLYQMASFNISGSNTTD